MTFSPLFQISLNEVSALISTLSTNSVARYELGQYKCTCDTVKYAAGIATFKFFLLFDVVLVYPFLFHWVDVICHFLKTGHLLYAALIITSQI